MYLKIMKLLLFLYTYSMFVHCKYLESWFTTFDNFEIWQFLCVFGKKVFVKYMGKTFNQLYYWPQRWHSWEIRGLCLMKFPSVECFKICQLFGIFCDTLIFFPKVYPGVFQHRSSGQLCVENNDTWDCTLQKNMTNS